MFKAVIICNLQSWRKKKKKGRKSNFSFFPINGELQTLSKQSGQQVTTGCAGVIHPKQARFSQTSLE